MTEYGPDITEEALKKRRVSEKKDAELEGGDNILTESRTPVTNSGSAKRAAQGAMENNAASNTDMVANGAMASGNPYAMAAGAALKTITISEKQAQEKRNAKAQAENQRLTNQQEALARMMEVANGLRRL